MYAGVVAPPGPPAAHERAEQLLTAVVAAATRGAGGSVLLRGEPGIGTTTLLERLVAAAPQARAIRVRGVRAAAVPAYAALADLLEPLHDAVDAVPARLRDAIEISLALRAGELPGPDVLGAAVLAVLATASRSRPVLVLVDDLHRVDSASRQVLLLVAGRLADIRVAMIMATGHRPGDVEEASGLATVTLAGLSVAECRAVLAAHHIELPAPQLERLVAAAGGNPRAVLAAARPVTPGGTGATRSPTAPLPSFWAAALDEFAESTARALYVVAVSQPSRPRDVEAVLVALGGSASDLAPAERMGLLHVRSDGLALRHPRLRTMIMSRMPPDTRIAVRRALTERGLGHRVERSVAAGTGPAEGSAAELAAAAAGARARQDPQESARLWARAAELTANPGARAELLLSAATDALLTGLGDTARGWCEEALALRSDPAFVADAEIVRGRATAWSGHPVRAIDGLLRAGEAILAVDPQRAADLFVEAALPAAMANRVSTMLELVQRGDAARAPAAPSPSGVVAGAVALVLSGRAAAGRRRLAAAEPLVSTPSGIPDAQAATMLGQARVWLEQFDAAQHVLDSVVDRARRDRADGILGLALAVRAELAWWTGQWASGHADATEAVRWADGRQQVGGIGFALATLARLDAGRGDVVACRVLMDRALRETGPYGLDGNRLRIDAVLGFAALAAGDPETAAQHLDQARCTADRGGLGATLAVPFGGDLVEAHLRAGHTRRAREALDWFEERAAGNGLVFPAAAALRYRGLLATDAELAGDCFARARALPGLRTLPFELGRTLLCEAETLRRLRRPTAARPILIEVRGIFAGLGARPWVTRTDRELATTGITPVPPSGRGLEALTPRELQIARSVADGLNNSEAASAHFISRRTVEAHLARIYRKLGIRSRTELVRKVGPLTGEGDD